MDDVQEFRNPIAWGDVSLSVTVTIGFIVIATILFLISNNANILWIFSILLTVFLIGNLLPTLLTSPSMIRMERGTVSVKTRFGRYQTFPYNDIQFIKLGNGLSSSERYGVFKTIYQNHGSYFVKYDTAVTLIVKYQENTGTMPQIEVGP